jgi:hypothetical protein
MKSLTAVFAVLCAVSVARADTDRAELLAGAAAKSNAGDHGAAIALYERVYFEDLDPSMLPILATEYRRAGLPLDAMSYFCHYLSTAPKGPQAAYATAQVIQLRTELGQKGVVCDAPKPTRVDFRPKAQKKMSKREIAGVATAAFGVISVGVGVYYGFEARSISNQISNHAQSEAWPADIQSLEARGERYESRQNQLLLVGGAALVTAGVLYFTGRADRLSEEKLFVAPSITAGGAGISFARGF